MASKAIYSIVAVLGIAGASGAAWWFQNKPQGPQEVKAGAPGTSGPGAAPGPAGAASGPRPAGVEVAKVERATLQDDAQSVGTLRSRQSVMMRPEVPGRVKAIGFVEGASVRRGQLLVQLDDTLQKAEIKQAQAQVSIAQANFRRNQELVAQNFVAQRVLEESAANLQVAEAQLALVCARLSRMAIIAPFDGTAGLRNVNLGDFVKDGADLINIEDIGSMVVDFRLPERFQSRLRLRQSVELQLDSFPGRIFKASVEAIDPLLDVNGRSVGIRAVLPNTMGEPMAQGRPGGPGGGPAGAASAPKPAAPLAAAARPGAAAARAQGGQPVAGARGGPPSRAAGPAQAVSRPAASGTTPSSGRDPVDANGCAIQADAPALAVAAPERPQGARAAGAPGRPGAGPSAGGNPLPLRPGMFARVNTVFSIKEAAIVIPEEAIVPQGGRQFVFKAVDPSALPPAADRPPLPGDIKLVSMRQEVRLGVRQLGKVEVLDGLKEGETVVVAGHQRLQRDGTGLRIVELGRPPSGAGAPAGAASGAAGSPAGAASTPAGTASAAVASR